MADIFDPDLPPLNLDDDETPKQVLARILQPNGPAVQGPAMPPPSTPPRSGTAQSTPLTGSLATAPQQAYPKVSGPAMIPGVAAKPEDLLAPQRATVLAARQKAMALPAPKPDLLAQQRQKVLAYKQKYPGISNLSAQQGTLNAAYAQKYPGTQAVAPAMAASTGGSAAMPSMGTIAQPSVQPDRLNMQTAQAQAKLADMRTKGSGIDQIKRPWLRDIARVGDVAGTILFPGATEQIPGTTLHHELLENQQAGNVANLQAQQQARAGLDATQAETAQRQAETAQQQAQTYNLQHPKPELAPLATAGGYENYDKNTGTATPLVGPDNKPIMPLPKGDTTLRPATVAGPGGKPMLANYNAQAGQYFDNAGKLIPNAQPYEKPAPQTELGMWLAQNPGKTVNDFMATQNAMKPEFPRIMPVNDAKGNTRGYVTFSGTGGGVKTQYVPISGVAGLPQSLGGPPGVIPPKPTAAVLTQSQRAAMIQPQVTALQQQIQKVAPELGPLRGRFSDVLTGTVGANNPDIAKLQMQLTLFTTALMLAHGLRGQEYEHALGHYLRAAQSPDNLLARIQGADGFLQDYVAATGHGPSASPQQPNAAPNVEQPKPGYIRVRLANGQTGTIPEKQKNAFLVRNRGSRVIQNSR